MNTYARIDGGVVAELLSTAADPADLFHSALCWVAVTVPGVAQGWHATADGFAPPPPPPAVVPPAPPTLMELHARLTALAEQVAALAAPAAT